MILNSTTTCEASGSGTICSTIYAPDPSSTVATANGFTYGEVVNSVEIFFILLAAVAIIYHLKFQKIKIQK